MAPKYWKKRILNDHLRSIDKTHFKAKSKLENSVLKHFKKVEKSERVIVQMEQIQNVSNEIEDLDESQNDMVIDENPGAKTEVDYEQDLIICEEDNQDILEVHEANKQGFQGGQFITDKEDQVSNDNQTIKEDQAPHPYAVPEPSFNYQENEVQNINFEHQSFDDDYFAEEFTPIPPMFEGQEDYIPEFSGHKNATDFSMWIRRVKKQEWNNVQKKNVPWKNWNSNDFRRWFTNALVYQTRIQDPKSTPLFIKSLKNTEHKRFMFGEMERSQSRRKCWKSLNFD